MNNQLKEIKAYFKQKYIDDPKVLSVAVIENPNSDSPLIDGYDLLFFIITSEPLQDEMGSTSHYIKDAYRIQERRIDSSGIQSWILNGDNRNIIQWILQGEILLDAQTYLEGLRHRLLEFPQPLRDEKLLTEFSHFLKRYLQTKQYLQAGHYLDAYSNVLEALHHWARIAIIEHGVHPEITVWEQVRRINPGVYKLYEELTQSTETVEQRVQLVLLACDFSVMSKMQHCCKQIIEVLKSREQPWSVEELKTHEVFKHLNLEMSLILKKMVKRSLIKEVAEAEHSDLNIIQLKYTV